MVNASHSDIDQVKSFGFCRRLFHSVKNLAFFTPRESKKPFEGVSAKKDTKPQNPYPVNREGGAALAPPIMRIPVEATVENTSIPLIYAGDEREDKKKRKPGRIKNSTQDKDDDINKKSKKFIKEKKKSFDRVLQTSSI